MFTNLKINLSRNPFRGHPALHLQERADREIASQKRMLLDRRFPHIFLLGVFLQALSGCPLALGLDSVEPSAVLAGESTELLITGSGFGDGTTFRINAPGIEATLGNTDISSSNQAQARLPASVPPGTYDLTARSSTAEATIEGALTVYSQAARIVFLDVGQGDATLVIAPEGETLLIDGGKTGRAALVEDAIETYAGGRLDAVVLSHFDADHLGGLVGILSGADRRPGTADDLLPDHVWAPVDDGSCTSQICDDMRALTGISFETPSPGDLLSLGSIDVTVVAVDGKISSSPAPSGMDDNSKSVVVELAFGGRRILVLGDLTGGGSGTVDLETPLAQNTGPVDVVRVAHHGSATSSPQSALAIWQPQMAILSLGTDNSYCHPDPDVLARWADNTASLYATGLGVTSGSSSCDAATLIPSNGQFGMGDLVLEIDAAGQLTMNDGDSL
jgi:beta-lactamase superfamily II metal-dependent hydrolase